MSTVSKLAFLKSITVEAPTEQPKSRIGTGKKEWNPPSGLTIRLWRNGAIFPSQELVDKFNLNYPNRLPEEDLAKLKADGKPLPSEGYGFDVADSDDFPIFNTGGTRLLVISPVKREELKVDLFSSVSYNVDGTPKSSVMSQGTTTFGNEFLIPFIEQVYGIKFYKPGKPAIPAKTDDQGVTTPEVPAVPEVEGVEYVDLVLLGQQGENSEPFKLPNGKTVAFFPKRFSRGENKGASTTVRRENPEMYVLFPREVIEESSTKEEALTANAEGKV